MALLKDIVSPSTSIINLYGEGVEFPESLKIIEIGKGRIIREGEDLAILALGTRVGTALKVADILIADSCSITVADARFAKPIDTDLVEKIWNDHQKLIIIEEGFGWWI